MLKARCSSLPLISICPQAAYAPTIRMELFDARSLAPLGNSVHEAIAHTVGHGSPADLATIADAWNVDHDELRPIYAQAVWLWSRICGSFPEPAVETFLEHRGSRIHLTGHADVVSLADGEARIGDWKSGWKSEELDHEEQMKGYAFLACLHTGADRASATILWPRVKHTYTWRWSRAALCNWFERLQDSVHAEALYCYGSHCGRCPRYVECPTVAEKLKRTLGWFTDREEGWPHASELLPEDLLHLYERVGHIATACEIATDAIKAEVASRGGIKAANGIELVLASRQRKEVIYTLAREALQSVLGEEGLAQCLQLPSGKLEKAIAATVDRGKGKKIKEVMESLDSLGAIERHSFEVLELRKAKEAKSVGVSEGDA